MKIYKKINFEFAYEWASSINNSLLDEESLFEFFEDKEKELVDTINKFNKKTVLHIFIKYVIKDHYDFFLEDMLKDSEYEIIVDNFIRILNVYEVAYEYKFFDLEDFDEGEDIESYSAVYVEYIKELKNMVDSIIDKMTDDIFFVLYGDRSFLLNFNYKIVEFVKELDFKTYRDILSRNGILKRCSYIPTWLKKGLMFRDKGRCLGCGKDLTGVFLRDEKIHYDHIIPLALHGINDPTNMQLLCEECNLKKSGNKIYTSEKYPSYW